MYRNELDWDDSIPTDSMLGLEADEVLTSYNNEQCLHDVSDAGYGEGE